MRGHGQKELIKKQRESEESKSSIPLPITIGSIVEFVENPQFNGKVKSISNDQWQTIYIDYGGKFSKLINGYEFMDLLKKNKIIIK